MKLFAGSREGSQLTDDGSGAQQTIPLAPDTWKEFGIAQQREADENRNLTTSISRQRRGFYLPVKGKFAVSTAFACAWVFLSWTLAQPWLSELAKDIGYAPAVVIIFFIALFPGFLNAHIISSVILDRPPELRFDMEYPPGTAAVAGCVLVKNSRETFMTRLQEWDYFTGIASAKRQQSLYQGTLVAQGAFSAFSSKVVKAHKGWPSVIGEDIVLTWALIKSGWRIGFEPTAVGFTTAPTTLNGFFRQRKRWARGMIEGLKQHGHLIWSSSRLSAFFVGIDFVIPLMDLFYTFVFLPGIILALFGYYYILGPTTLLVLPMAFLIVFFMYRKQQIVFRTLRLRVRQNFAGFIVYMLIYQIIMSPICVIGYVQEVLGTAKRW